MRKTTLRLIAASALTLLAACESATSSDGNGDARVQMAIAGDDAASSAQATVGFQARAYVQTGAGAWVELTDGAYEQVSVAAFSTAGSATVFASENVAAGAYTRVRLVFREVDVDVQGALQVASGTLTGNVTVNAGTDGEIVVERQISVNVSSGATARLLLDLNSNLWLSQASAQSRIVSETAFASAIAVTAQ